MCRKKRFIQIIRYRKTYKHDYPALDGSVTILGDVEEKNRKADKMVEGQHLRTTLSTINIPSPNSFMFSMGEFRFLSTIPDIHNNRHHRRLTFLFGYQLLIQSLPLPPRGSHPIRASSRVRSHRRRSRVP